MITKQNALFMLAMLVASFLGGAMASLLLGDRTVLAKADVVAATSFTLVDEEGRSRGGLWADSSGTKLSLRSADGRSDVHLYAGEGGRMSVNLTERYSASDAGKSRFWITSGGRSYTTSEVERIGTEGTDISKLGRPANANLFLQDAVTGGSLQVTFDSEGPYLRMSQGFLSDLRGGEILLDFEADGPAIKLVHDYKDRAVLGVTHTVSKTTEERQTTAPSSLTLYNSKGTVVWQAP